jgi:hypothetical protein
MTDELIEYVVLTLFTLGSIFLTSYLHSRSEKRRKLDHHILNVRLLSRDPYSAQDAYTRRLERQS